MIVVLFDMCSTLFYRLPIQSLTLSAIMLDHKYLKIILAFYYKRINYIHVANTQILIRVDWYGKSVFIA